MKENPCKLKMIGTLSAFSGVQRIHLFFYFVFLNRYFTDGMHDNNSHGNIKIVY